MSQTALPDRPSLSRGQTWGLAAVGLLSFHVAYFWEVAGILVVFYLAAMYYLPRAGTTRSAFYLGFLIGFAVGVPHLLFFFALFGWGAIGLWGVFALWFSFYLLLGRVILDCWPRAGGWLLPFLWFGLEFFRSELYPLRFSWLIPGFALSHQYWLGLASAGVYGFSLFVMLAVAVFDHLPRRLAFPFLGACSLLIAAALFFPTSDRNTEGPLVVGMQMESPEEYQVVEGLAKMNREHPKADLLLLSEYTFSGPIPESVRDWCRANEKYLLAGGRDLVDGSDEFYNTVFVVSPEGEIVFRQAKAQPIQFFNDGLPAKSQEVWESPWGRLGIGICYDMSYSRVMDPLIQKKAQGLIIPAVDLITWGRWEHELHAKIVPVRAREYGLPLFRLASSGVSKFVDDKGTLLESGSFPGTGEILAARLPVESAGRLPLDRYLALPIVCGMSLVILATLAGSFRR